MRPRLAPVLAIAACYGPSAPLGAPCADDRECPSGQVCDELAGACVAWSSIAIWRDDAASDFAGGALTAAAIEPGGFVGPISYVVGRIRTAGIASDVIDDPALTPWSSLGDAPVTGHGFAISLDLDYGTSFPPGMGLTGGDNVTVLVEGELELDASGVWGFELVANDSGLFELAPPGGDFVRVAAGDLGGATGTFSAPAAGWYRFRAAFADSNMLMYFRVRYDPPNVPGNFRDIPPARLRTRLDDLSGYHIDAFDEPDMIEYYGAPILANTPLAGDLDSEPYQLQFIGTTSWSLRWAGQILIDIGGEYAFTFDTAQGHRAWLDQVQIADAFDTTDVPTTTAPIALEAGWHDLVIDVQKTSATPTPRLAVTIASGPAGVGQPIALDHVRPIVDRTIGWAAAHSGAALAVPDGGTATRTINLGLPAQYTPVVVHAAYELAHATRDQLSLVLDVPVGADRTLIAAASLSGSGTHSGDASIPSSTAGASWGFIAGDSTVDATGGSLLFAAVSVPYVGADGPLPFPTAFRYESNVRALTHVRALGALRWHLRQGGAATMWFRTCDDAAGCASAPWVRAEQGATPEVAPAAFAQYALDVTTDGDRPTAIDWVELQYSTSSPQ